MIPLIPIVAGIGALAVTSVTLSAFISHLRNVSIHEGYRKASNEFDQKFQRQYEEFMSKEKTWEKNKKEYEDLIKAYQEYCDELRRESEELKKNGENSEPMTAVATLGTALVLYEAGLNKEIMHYEECLNNLRDLREKE